MRWHERCADFDAHVNADAECDGHADANATANAISHDGRRLSADQRRDN